MILVGWDDLPDLSTVQTRDELRELYQQTYLEEGEGTSAQAVGQLWSFTREIEDGDLAILPLKTDSTVVAVGRVTSAYRYRSDLGTRARNTHAVTWLTTAVPRSAFAADFLASINGPRTVSRVGTASAEERSMAILEGHGNPGWGKV